MMNNRIQVLSKLSLREKLTAYFTELYKQNDADKIEVPYFLKAIDTVKDLVEKNLLDDVYKHIIKKGVAC